MPPVCNPPHTGGMSLPEESTLQAVRELEDEFAEAMSHMYSVGNGLARLRVRLDREASPQQWAPVAAPTAPAPEAPAPAATHTPAPGPTGAVTAPPVAHTPFAPQPPQAPPRALQQPTTPWWQRDGLVARLLAVVGTGITLIGVAFLLALAIQMGFFGPLARVISGVLLAALLVTAAIVVRRRQASPAGALGLAATGIATAYLDVIAITSIYEWVPAAVGLVIAGLVAIGGLLLARAWDSQLLACIAVLGVAVLAPTIAHEHLLLVGWFLLVLTIASWPAQVSRRWHVLELVRVVPTALVISLLAVLGEPGGTVILLTCLLAGFVLATSLAGVRITAAPAQAGIVIPVLAVPALFATALVEQWVGSTLMIALTLALLLVGALTAGRHGDGEKPDSLLVSAFCLYTAGATSLLSAALVTDGTGWTLPALLAVCVAWAAAAFALRDHTLMGAAVLTSAIPLLLALALVPYAVDRSLSPQVEPAHVVAAALTVVLLLALAATVTVTHSRLVPLATRTLIAGALLGAGGTVIITGIVLGDLADNARGGFTAGQTGATVLWLSTAAVLLLRGLRGSTFAVPAGLTVTALCVGKLLFFDLAFLDGVPRVLSFIIGGLIVLGMGAGYAQALERSRRDPEPVDNSGSDSHDPHTV